MKRTVFHSDLGKQVFLSVESKAKKEEEKGKKIEDERIVTTAWNLTPTNLFSPAAAYIGA